MTHKGMKQRGFRYCSTCHTKLQKWGKTKAGTPRWRCPQCASTNIRARPDRAKALRLEQFVTWLLGKQSQTETAGSANAARTWRMQTAWCWDIVPKPALTGQQYPILLLDGIRVGSLVCLIARTSAYVVAWHWAPYEASTTWDKLLVKLPAPTVAVCDGQKGVLLAIVRCWPDVRIQRCHFHVWQNMRAKLTLNPQTAAGRQLLQLARGLLKGLLTLEQANLWIRYLETWEQTHGSFLKERTYAENRRPGTRQWRYTHERLRSAYRQIAKLLRDDQLFTYLDETLQEQTKQPIPRTTNYVEGGINSQLRTKLKLHRGMSETHQRRLVEWYLYTRTEEPKPTRKFL